MKTYSKVLSEIKTQEDAAFLSSEVKILQDSMFLRDGSFQKSVAKSVRKHIADIIQEELRVGKYEVSTYLDGLEKELEKLRSISLILAFEPSQVFVDELSLWIKKEVGENVVLEILRDKSIVGGVKISFEGRFADLSLKKAIDEWFREKWGKK